MAEIAVHYVAFKYAVLVITFFNLLAWFLLLGGLSAIEDKRSQFAIVSQVSNRASLGIPWFLLWFQLLLIIAAFIIEFQNRQTAWRNTLNIVVAITTTLACIETERFFGYRDGHGSQVNLLQGLESSPALLDATRGLKSRINVVISGFIILAIFNFLLIILSGSRGALEDAYGENRDLGVASYPHTPSANTAPAVPSSQKTAAV